MIIGKNTYVHPTALLGQNVTVGDNCHIGPYCIIGFPAEWKGNEDKDMGVIICDGTRLTGLVTVDSGANNPTFISENCYLMKHSHIGHDAILGHDVTLSCGAKIGGHSFINAECNIGLNAVVHQKVEVPHNCMIGASAFIGKTLVMEPHRKYAGVPAKDIGENKR